MKVTHSRMRVCTSKEMRQIDDLAHAQYQIDASILMENAGRAAADVLFECYPNAGDETEVLIFAGKGNNAGDAFVLARRLICLERRVRIFCLAPPSALTGAAKRNFEILKQMNGRVFNLENVSELESFFRSSTGPYTIIDGMVGTGLRGNLDGIYYDVVETINRQKCNEVMSLDIPTGVNADSGEIHGTSILANTTVSFGFPKLGHFLPPGAGRRGDLPSDPRHHHLQPRRRAAALRLPAPAPRRVHAAAPALCPGRPAGSHLSLNWLGPSCVPGAVKALWLNV